MSMPNVMLVSDRLDVQQAFAYAIAECGLTLVVATSVRDAESVLDRSPIALVFCSDETPRVDIETLIHQDWRPNAKVPVIVFSRLDDWERYLKFLRAGAFDYVLYPPGGREFERVVRQALIHSDTGKRTQPASAA